MAGFFIVLGDTKDEKGNIITTAHQTLDTLCRFGIYSTNLFVNENVKKWSKPKVATYADYFSMREGDYIFFFTGRKIYGVGKLVNIGNSCAYWAYSGANKPILHSEENIADTKLFDIIHPENRCVCFFKPVTYFPNAIDMDEALTSYPDSFKSLRVIQGRTFIKMDDEEALALFSVISRGNVDRDGDDVSDWTPPLFDDSKHKSATEKINANESIYRFDSESLLSNFPISNSNMISEEMAIEAALVECLNNNMSKVFDKVSYVSHQVSASPAKPVEYMEWMDVFGYSTSDYLVNNSVPIQFAIKQYFIAEIKRDSLCLKYTRQKEPKWVGGVKAVANQLMKYVDWVAKNYASGRYQMVKGILVANGFDDEFISYCKKMCIRNYNDGYRDSTPAVWENIELIKYSFDGKKISFEKVSLD